MSPAERVLWAVIVLVLLVITWGVAFSAQGWCP